VVGVGVVLECKGVGVEPFDGSFGVADGVVVEFEEPGVKDNN
jgi:hypothetical protein